MAELILGLAVVVLAAIVQGCFMVPMTYVKNWKWENSWAVFSILSMVVFNWILGFSTIPQLADIYAKATATDFIIPAFFGFCWGIGAIGFGLGIAAVGLALGYAIIMALVLSLGAFIPMVILHPSDIFTAKGIIIIIGVVVMISGIALFGKAGIRKEKEQGQKTGRITELSKASMKLGIIICIIGGVFSCFPNVGFALSGALIKLAEEFQTDPKWAANSIWTIMFTSGAIANLAYCGYLFKKNGSFKDYKNPGLLRNLALMSMTSLLWIVSFVLYGVGASIMGSWGSVIGWSVFIAMSIAVAGIWGIIQGEWKNTSVGTRKLMGFGLGILVIAIMLFAYSASK